MNKPYKIAVIDYRMSNMFSIENALTVLGFDVEVTSDYSTIVSCDGAILPGVGSFPEAMKHIKELKLDVSINDFIASGKPFLGICLGFQLLFNKSDEIEDTFGLGIIPGGSRSAPRTEKRSCMATPRSCWDSSTNRTDRAIMDNTAQRPDLKCRSRLRRGRGELYLR